MADDPENTLVLTLDTGTVSIRLRPDLASGAMGPDQGTGPRGVL